MFRSGLTTHRLLVMCVTFLVSCIFATGFSEPALASAPSTLTTVLLVRMFKPDALPMAAPIHLHAVVTYYDSVGPNLFVQDATGGVWVDLRASKVAPPRVGQMLDLTGVVGAGFSPYVANPRWKELGSSPLPKPAHISFEQASTGSFDSQWVEMEGVVRSFVQQVEGNVLVIDVATPTGAFKVRVPDYHAAFPMELVDAKVRFRGVDGSAFNRRNQLVAIHLMMPGMEFLDVIEGAPADPFAIATTPVEKIGGFSPQLSDLHRVKVRGVITARFAGRGFFLKDETGGVYAESQDGTPASPGQEVEVIGFPAKGDYSAVLKSAGIRELSKHEVLVPSRIDGVGALKGLYDARLVTITGTLQAVNPLPKSYSLLLRSDDQVNFIAIFGVHSGSNPAPAIGSKLDLTGICSVKTDENGSPSAFQVVLRSPDDIKLLASPPWLTSEHAAFILTSILVLTAAVFGWVIILRRRVRNQTELIKTRLENEVVLEERYRRIFERNLTGLYVAGSDGEIIDCNQTCARILGYPSRDALLENRQEARLITEQFHQHLHEDLVGDTNQIRNAERRFQRRDRSWRWALINIRLVSHADGAHASFEAGLVDITDRKTAEEQVHYLAYYDSLTGLPNRSLLKDRLAIALPSARRHKEKVAILFLDLDRFKIINDSMGHSYGDLLLKEVSERLRKVARKEDTVTRVGGDEFLIVLTSIKDADDAAIAAERIAKEMENEFVIHGQTFNVSCSIGISMFPEHGCDDETLIKNADAAMYCAKDSGRSTFRFFTEDMNADVVERLKIENDLCLSMERNELFLVYQPQLSLTTGNVTGFECLIRWQHPEMGLVPPNRFIPVAESSRLIIPMGEWVLRTSCAQVRKWQDAGHRIPSIAVNVSAIQFRQEGFCELVKTILKDTGLAPKCLELELTESLLLSSGDLIFSVLAELKKMGVKLAIDDFGTGYSSLSYLRQFPVSKIKIDGSFIKDISENPDDAAITTAIIDMGKALNLKMIAECVETEAQVSFLQARRCDEIQGYYFSKPLIAEEVEQRLVAYEARSRAADKTPTLELEMEKAAVGL